VADLRAPTPTAAAELAAPVRDELLAALAAHAQRLRARASRRLEAQAQRLDRLALQLARPTQALARSRERLQNLALRRDHALARALDAERARLPRLAERLHAALRARRGLARALLDVLAARAAALDPSRVLARGYAFALDEQGQAVTSAAAVRPGQALALQWHDGRASVRVEDRE
jgi:exodeoxyribonuclease VII large subunit